MVQCTITSDSWNFSYYGMGDLDRWLATHRGLPSLPTFFFASHKGGNDAEGRDGGAGEKGDLKSRIEDLLIPAEVDKLK